MPENIGEVATGKDFFTVARLNNKEQEIVNEIADAFGEAKSYIDSHVEKIAKDVQAEVIYCKERFKDKERNVLLSRLILYCDKLLYNAKPEEFRKASKILKESGHTENPINIISKYILMYLINKTAEEGKLDMDMQIWLADVVNQ